ncbi:MAG: tungsten formylmethanofuran dehydrogenase [Phyllobacterium sp.]
MFSLDSDVHGTRGAIALAERLGAAYDHTKGHALVNQIALYTNHGGFFTTPTETRRRADMIVIVGDIPAAHHDLVVSWRSVSPDLTTARQRTWYHLKGAVPSAEAGKSDSLAQRVKAHSVASGDLPLGGVLGVARAVMAGKQVSTILPEIDRFAGALAKAAFPVFVFSGDAKDPSSPVMLQGLVADINKSRRASALFLPSDDDAWGTVLTSLWMTGFPPRTSFSTGMPIYDPLLWNIDRMIVDREADLHVWISERGSEQPQSRVKVPLIAVRASDGPVARASVTFRIGRTGVDHDGVVYSSRIGTFKAVAAAAPSDLPNVSQIMRQLAEALPGGGVLPC